MRILPFVSLGFLSISTAACYEHHTADEQVAELATPPDAGVDAVDTRDGGGGPRDAGADCSKLTGLQALTCSLGGGGSDGLNGIIDAILGGGASGATNCSKQPDPTAQLLCTLAGGSGLEGIINGLLGGGGGGLLGDAGVNGLVQGAITEVLSGIIDDLIGSLFPQPNRDAGGLLGGGGFLGGTRSDAGGVLGGLFGGGQLGRDGGTPRRDAGAGNKSGSLDEDDGFRTAEECASPDPEDRLTRLLCLRQKLVEIEALTGPGAAP